MAAAIESFATNGYHATTTRDIANAAGMSPAQVADLVLAGIQERQSASVTRPDSLQHTLGSCASWPKWRRHSRYSFTLMSGLPR